MKKEFFVTDGFFPTQRKCKDSYLQYFCFDSSRFKSFTKYVKNKKKFLFEVQLYETCHKVKLWKFWFSIFCFERIRLKKFWLWCLALKRCFRLYTLLWSRYALTIWFEKSRFKRMLSKALSLQLLNVKIEFLNPRFKD